MQGMLCGDNFRELKKKLTTTSWLILSDLKEPFVVYCDASKMGINSYESSSLHEFSQRIGLKQVKDELK